MNRSLILTVAVLLICPFILSYAQRPKQKTTINQNSSLIKGEKQSSNGKTISQPTGYVNGYGYVDLGLPSGTKWAICNVGASSPSDYGSYFAWGETAFKQVFTTSNSITYHKNGNELKSLGIINQEYKLSLKYDAANVNWGDRWRMPTSLECQELVNKCKWMWITYSGKKGYKVVGPNKNSIFIPAAGVYRGSISDVDETYGSFWSSSPNEKGIGTVEFVYFLCDEYGVTRYSTREEGRSVRAVL